MKGHKNECSKAFKTIKNLKYFPFVLGDFQHSKQKKQLLSSEHIIIISSLMIEIKIENQPKLIVG